MKLLIVRHGDPDYSIDSLTEKGWREAEFLSEKLSKLANIIAVNREDNNLHKENIEKYNIKIIIAPRIDISSTLIRERIKENKAFRYFLKDKVYNYIISNKLYL